MAKDALSEYSAKRTFTATPEPPAQGSGGRRGARCCSSSSSTPPRGCTTTSGSSATACSCRGRCPRDRRSTARKAARGANRGPPLRLRVVRGRYSRGAIRRGRGHRLGLRRVFARRRRRDLLPRSRASRARSTRRVSPQGKLSVLLRGEKLKGSFALVRTKEAKQWLLIKHKDRFAAEIDVTTRDRSVLSGMSVGELKFLPPVERMAAVAPGARGQGRADARPRSRRCSPSPPTRPSTAPSGCGSRSSTAIACSPSSTATASSCARGAGSSCRVNSRASWPSSPSRTWTA